MLKLALLNLTRNPRRSILTAFAILVAVFVIILILSFIYTVIDDMEENSKSMVTGDIRIRNAKYTEYEDLMPLQFYIEDIDKLKDRILSIQNIASADSVSKLYASVYIDGELKSVSVIGADTDSAFFNGSGVEITGKAPRSGEKEIMVTRKFLNDFNLELGDSVTLISNTTASSTNASTYKIVGEVFYNNSEFNNANAVMPIDMLSALTHMDNGTLEILVRVNDDESKVEDYVKRIDEELKLDYLEISSWHETSIIYTMIKVYDIMYFIIEALFFLIASTLVINTTMMSVIERKKECATMIAIGFSRRGIRALFILESFIIALVGSVVAIIVGYAVVRIFGAVGLDTTMFGVDAVEGWNFPRYMYLRINAFRMFGVGVVAIAVSVVAAILGTLRIRKIEVADELREEM